MRIRSVTSFALLVIGRAASAQDPTNMPVSVTANPQWDLPGTRFTLRGATVADGVRTGVTISVTSPEGTPTVLPARVDKGGEYSAQTAPLKALGTYRVAVVAPDGKGRDTTSFRVLSLQEALEEVQSEWDKDVEDAYKATKQSEEMVKGLPASPPRTEAEAKLKRAVQELERREQARREFGAAIDAVRQVQEKQPGSGASDRINRDLLVWLQRSREERADYNRQLLEAGARRGKGCESINAAGEGIKVASGFVALAGEAVGVVTAFLKDYIADQGTRGISNAGAAGAAQQAIRNGQAVASFQVVGLLPGLMSDLAGYFTGQLFDQYCERFAGPVEGSIHVEFVDKNGQPWWIYDVVIQGTLELRYAKTALRSAIKMSGEFYGSGTRFSLWERALEHTDPKLMRATYQFKKYWTPFGAPFIETEGRYVGAFGPRAFFIPVVGELVDTLLTLRIQDAKTDFAGLEAQGFYVIIGQLTMGFPVVLRVPFPYTGARSIIRKSLDAEARPAVLRVDVNGAGKKMLVDSTVVRKKVAGDGYNFNTELKVRVCNPACSS